MNSLNITNIGKVNFRNDNRIFGIKDIDRLGHIYAIGKTGTGKSTLLLNMAYSDAIGGNGFCIIDPHGDIAQEILDYIPRYRIKDVIYFNPADTKFPVAFNPLKGVHPDFHHLAASGIISSLKKIWAESWGPRMEHILRFTLLTLLEYPNATLLDIQPLLTNAEFRTQVLNFVKNPATIAFWMNEFAKYSPNLKSEAVSPIINKTSIFLTSIPLRNIVGQTTNSFKMQSVLDEGKILIVNLSKGLLGEDASTLMGSFLVTSIQLAAMSRAGQPEYTRRPFYLYVDEAHSFISESFADILSESRKYKLSLFFTHQYTEQLQDKIGSAIFGNVGTMISFRVGASDAEVMAKEFFPEFSEVDIINLPKFHMYIKMMIDGATSQPFSAITLPKPPLTISFKDEIIAKSKIIYGRYKV